MIVVGLKYLNLKPITQAGDPRYEAEFASLYGWS